MSTQFGCAFYSGTTQAELDERRQFGKFLEAAAFTSLLRYPVEVEHTRDRNPDFRLMNGPTMVVGVEVTKIAKEKLEEARRLNRERGDGTMCISSYLKESSDQRTREAGFAESQLPPVFPEGIPIEEEDESWLNKAESVVRRKTEIYQRPNFERQQENWLLLWDKLSSSPEDLERRVPKLLIFLRKFWKNDGFSKVIVEQSHFQCFVILSPEGATWLRSCPEYSNRLSKL